ncbi:MAG: hypothetical protein AAGG38_09535 [Planctomycetota bacterium]
MKSTPILTVLTAAASAALATGCATTVADLEGPAYRQKLNTPAPVSVTLDPRRADPDSFRVTVDGRDITEAFAFTDQTARLTGYVFEPAAPLEPHRLTVTAEPTLNAKGRPMGRSYEETLTFFPPRITVQGNVGLGPSSRIDLTRDGRTSVMVTLPAAPRTATDFTVSHEPQGDSEAFLALDDLSPGEPTTVTFAPGRRVAVFTVRGTAPGLGALRVESPGYVATTIDTIVEGTSLSAVVDGP